MLLQTSQKKVRIIVEEVSIVRIFVEIRTLNESESNENMLLNLEKSDYFYVVAGNLTNVHSRILWEAEFVITELEYLTEKISKQRVLRVIWLLPGFCSNVQE